MAKNNTVRKANTNTVSADFISTLTTAITTAVSAAIAQAFGTKAEPKPSAKKPSTNVEKKAAKPQPKKASSKKPAKKSEAKPERVFKVVLCKADMKRLSKKGQTTLTFRNSDLVAAVMCKGGSYKLGFKATGDVYDIKKPTLGESNYSHFEAHRA